MTKKGDKTKISFEESLAKLEEIVRHLERGDLGLDDSLKAFEEGIKWSRTCEEKLTESKGKVEQLLKKEGAFKTVPFQDKE